MLKVFFGGLYYLFLLIRFFLVKATFLTWLVGVWAVIKFPALRLALQGSHPAVKITLALVSVLVVGRFVVWLMRATNGWARISEQPRPQPSVIYHYLRW